MAIFTSKGFGFDGPTTDATLFTATGLEAGRTALYPFGTDANSPTGYPDRLIIAAVTSGQTHVITLPASAVVTGGTDSGDTTANRDLNWTVDIKAFAEFKLDTGATLNSKGSLLIENNGKLRCRPGVTVNWDSTNNAAAVPWELRFGAAVSALNAQLIVEGTAASPVTFQTTVGANNQKTAFKANGSNGGSQTITGLVLDNMGNIPFTPVGATSVCNLNSVWAKSTCGTLSVGTMHASAQMVWQDVLLDCANDFTLGTNAKTNTRSWTRVGLGGTTNHADLYDVAFTNCYTARAASNGVAATTRVESIDGFVLSVGAGVSNTAAGLSGMNLLPTSGLLDRVVELFDGNTNNPHGINFNVRADRDYTVRRGIVYCNVNCDDGDLYFPSGPVDPTFFKTRAERCFVIHCPDGRGPGRLIAGNFANTGTIVETDHNTVGVSGWAETAVWGPGEGGSVRADMGKIRSNIAWSLYPSHGPKWLRADPATQLDIVLPANGDYNAGFRTATGAANHNGYMAQGNGFSAFSAGDPGAHDLDQVDPQFPQPRPTPAMWDLEKNAPLGTPIAMVSAVPSTNWAGLTNAASDVDATAPVRYVLFTVTAHGRSVGDCIEVSGWNQAEYNGKFVIMSTPTVDTFAALLPIQALTPGATAPALPANGTGAGQIVRIGTIPGFKARIAGSCNPFSAFYNNNNTGWDYYAYVEASQTPQNAAYIGAAHDAAAPTTLAGGTIGAVSGFTSPPGGGGGRTTFFLCRPCYA